MRKKWTKQELDILHKNYYILPKEKLLKKIPGRSWCSIYHQSRKVCEPHKRRISMAKKLNKLTSSQIAYLAGLIDGEGSIYLSIDDSKIRPYLTITMTHKETIFTIRKWVGCASIAYDKHYENEKDAWKFSVDAIQRQKDLLILLEPYLITKKEQAKTEQNQYILTLDSHEKTNPQKELFYTELKNLNHRGRQEKGLVSK